ncbi:MAG TPA: hypothetical protein PKY82_02705 [Pyrinomonadaceae bacterium]|nr:hypothetical protein [Pyrinomonadaceae bacterium]
MNALANFWWVLLPRLLKRFSPTLAAALTDGLYITTFPILAAVLSPVIFAIGLLFGCFGNVGNYFFTEAYTESYLFLALAIALGVLSAHLGTMLLMGFALGNYFLFFPFWFSNKADSSVFLYKFSWIISYALLAIVTTRIALITKSMLAEFYLIASLGKVASVILAIFGHLLITLGLVFLWSQLVPVLIRPIFTWHDAEPTIPANEPLQKYYFIFLGLAAVASLVRMALQAAATFSDNLSQKISLVEDAITENDVKPLSEYIPRVILALCAALWAALFLSGLYTSNADAVIVGVVVLVLQLLQRGVIPLPIGGYARLMESIPLALRLMVVTIVLYGVGYLILSQFWRVNNVTFRPMLFVTIFALVLFYLVNPQSPAPKKAEV